MIGYRAAPRCATVIVCTVLGLVVGGRTTASALPEVPHARFTERVTCPGTTLFGTDPLVAERIVVDVGGCHGRAETSGTGALLPGGSPPSAEAVLSSTDGGTVSAIVNYRFGVGALLPEGVGVDVPLLIHALLLVEFDGSASTVRDLTAWIGVGGRTVTLSACIPGGPFAGCSDREGHVVIPLALVADEDVDSLQLAVIIQGAGQGLHAIADPFIEIDPRFADREDFRVIVAEGVVNRAPDGGPPIGVPGPSAALMLTSGLVSYALVRLSHRIRGRPSSE